MARRCGVYVRISDDPEGLAAGVRRQEKDARELAQARGWEVVEVYNDNDLSASTGRKRPAWERLMQDLQSGALDAIVAYSSSRMYRRVKDLLPLVELAKERGIQIATCVSGNINLDTADGRMLAGILATVDQAEAERVSERLKATYRHGRAPRGGRRVFGYTQEGKVVKREAKLIQDAARRVASGWSAYRISKEWNAKGIHTAYGARWKPSSVARMLQGEHLVEGSARGWPGILSREEHELVVARFGREDRPRGRPRRRYVATSVVVCGECGAKLRGHNRGYGCPDLHVSIDQYRTERLLVEEALSRAPDVEDRKPTEDEEALLGEVIALEARAVEVEREIEAGKLPAGRGARILGGIDKQLDDVRARLGQAIEARPTRRRGGMDWKRAASMVDDWRERWKSGRLGDDEVLELQSLLRTTMEKAVVAPRAGRPKRWDPSRIHIVWRT